MKKYIYILLFLFALSCKENKEHIEYSYFYTKELKLDSLANKTTTYKAILINDTLKLYHLNDLIQKSKYKISDEGIYIDTNRNLQLLYSFNNKAEIKRAENLLPFFYKSVKLTDRKDYYLKNEKFTIYHFIEKGGDETLDSYYLKGEGFICFYKYADDKFLYLNSPKAIKVSAQFLNDKTFFAMLKMKEIDKKMGRKFE